MITLLKLCSGCGEGKDISEFTRGWNPCKSCRASARKAERPQFTPLTEAQRAERKLESQRRFRRDNPGYQRESRRTYARNYYALNCDQLKRQTSAYLRAHPEVVRAVRKRQVESMSPSYLRAALRLPPEQTTPELLDMKREQLTVYRLSRQLKTKLKETHETK